MQITLDHVRRWLTDNWNGGWGSDGWHITDYADSYGEPGYSGYQRETTLLVIGDWWVRNTRHNAARDDKLLHFEQIYPRLCAQLHELGVDYGLWDDEWTVHNGKAYRTTHDSYSWQPSLIYIDGEPYTLDELIEDNFAPVIAEGNGSDTYAFNMEGFDPIDHLEPLGWQQHNGEFANGWYPGQSDDPKIIGPRVRAAYGGKVDTLWCISGVGQFDIHFELWIRPHDDYQPEEADNDEPVSHMV